jgi:hypothetical protein
VLACRPGNKTFLISLPRQSIEGACIFFTAIRAQGMNGFFRVSPYIYIYIYLIHLICTSPYHSFIASPLRFNVRTTTLPTARPRSSP